MQKGDIFIINGTSAFGFTGHAGIAISSSKILHIEEKGYKPNDIPKNIWDNKYTSKEWTKIYRHKDSTIANKATNWANDTYNGSSAKYKITKDLKLNIHYKMVKN